MAIHFDAGFLLYRWLDRQRQTWQGGRGQGPACH